MATSPGDVSAGVAAVVTSPGDGRCSLCCRGDHGSLPAHLAAPGELRWIRCLAGPWVLLAVTLPPASAERSALQVSSRQRVLGASPPRGSALAAARASCPG